MKLKNLFIICFLLLTSKVLAEISSFANPPQAKFTEINNVIKNPPIIDLEGIPSSIVGGCVNAITGNYFECETDLYLPGPAPMHLQRFYNSSAFHGNLCIAWDLNLKAELDLTSSPDGNRTAIVTDRGSKLSFSGTSGNNLIELKLHNLYGIANCSSGILSARHNLRNRKIQLQKKSNTCLMITENGERVTYNPSSGDLYLACNSDLPNGCHLEYHHDKLRLIKLIAKGQKGAHLAAFDIQNIDHKVCVTVSGGQKILYVFEKLKYKPNDESLWALKFVIGDHIPNVSYEYHRVQKDYLDKIVRKNWPDGRYQGIRYYCEGANYVGPKKMKISKEDNRHGRVAILTAPVGSGSTDPVEIYKFIYEDQGNGKTVVYNARNYIKKYQNLNKNLVSIQDCYADESNYRYERNHWGNGSQETFLLARALEDGNKKISFCRCYEYDVKGNATKEIFAGNLTGKNGISPSINEGKFIDNGCEKYVKNYTYSETDLIETESDGIQSISYAYYKGFDLLESKFIKDSLGTIRERIFYEYDSNSVLIKEIYDDGSSKDKNNLENVTERHVKKIEPTTACPIGLPKIIEEYFVDIKTGQKILLKLTVNHYTPQGYITRSETYDSLHCFRHAREWQYNAMGKVIKEIDPLGQVTIKDYDANGNCIFVQTPDPSYHSKYYYDFSNRLIKEEDVHKDGTRLAQSFAYDCCNNCVASIDIYGNKTTYEYDEFNRLIKTNKLNNSFEKIGYDIANNPTLKVDGNGNATRIAYTAWGKPYFIQYSDSAAEQSEYSVDGNLIKVIDPRGTVTKFTYDYKKRKIKQEKYDPEGLLLCSQDWNYNNFHLLSETDPNGIVTYYTYDLAGRLLTVSKGTKKTTYTYDTLGRINETCEYIDLAAAKRTIFEYDNLDRTIEERIENLAGDWLEKKSFSYDFTGNKNSETFYIDQTSSTTFNNCNSYGKPTQIVYPDGTITNFYYRYDYKNSAGQSVAYEEEIDASGNVTRRIMDIAGNLAEEIKLDSFGQMLKETSLFYDSVGNLTRRIDNVMADSKTIRQVTTVFEYDSRGNQIRIVEASGLPEQKTTAKEFNFFGDLIKLIKPDGIVVTHRYDYLGRLVDMHSSDDTIHYTYTYDLNHNVLSVIDHINEGIIQRNFDVHDRLLYESFGDERNLSYTYDNLGRLNKLILPDNTTVDYIFDEHHLREVKRNSNHYVQKYSYYAYSGKLQNVELPLGLGKVNFRYDSCIRPVEISSQFWNQLVAENGYDPCGNLLATTYQDSFGEIPAHYRYDALHQLVSEVGFIAHNYQYDSLHNRTKKDEVEYENNSLNQLINEGERHYQYDKNGNLKITGERICTYDALDRLISIEDETCRCTYSYDAFHRRLKKELYNKSEGHWQLIDVEPYVYQGENEIGVFKNGGFTQLRILGIGVGGDVGAAISIELAQHVFIPLHDARGNIVSLLDAETKQVVEVYRYTGYGEEKVFDRNGEIETNSINPWRFSSKRVDQETSWLFFGRRYYDPRIGRWTTPDPLHFEDGPNLYSYVQNRPLMFIDPKGLKGSPSHSTLPFDRHMNTLASGITLGLYGGVEESTTYDVGCRELNHCMIMFVNGIRNSIYRAEDNAQHLSNMAEGCRIRGIYNSTWGWFDIGECVLNLLGVNTDPVHLLHQEWNNFFRREGENGRILCVCHSQGAIITRNALDTYDPEFRQRIDVICVAPAAYINRNVCNDVVHLVSDHDFVPWIDAVGRMRNQDTIVELNAHADADFWDHDFRSPTYTYELERLIEQFKQNNGVF